MPPPQPARAGVPSSPSGLLATLLDDAAGRDFYQQHYLRTPFAGCGTAKPFAGLLSDAVLAQLIATTSCELTLVKDGRCHPGPRPHSLPQAWGFHQDGYSLVFRHAEQHHPAIAAIGGRLALELIGELDAHVYVTPADHFSFGWHYDAEEVFFIHTAGVKEFYLRQNTVQPDPVPATMTRDLAPERETSPVMHCRLEPGDWLYIPRGWWHMAKARTDARSLSLGLLVPTPLTMLDALRRELARDPAWRQRMPPIGRALAPGDVDASERLWEALAAPAKQLAAAFATPSMSDRWLAQHHAQAVGLVQAHDAMGIVSHPSAFAPIDAPGREQPHHATSHRE